MARPACPGTPLAHAQRKFSGSEMGLPPAKPPMFWLSNTVMWSSVLGTGSAGCGTRSGSPSPCALGADATPSERAAAPPVVPPPPRVPQDRTWRSAQVSSQRGIAAEYPRELDPDEVAARGGPPPARWPRCRRRGRGRRGARLNPHFSDAGYRPTIWKRIRCANNQSTGRILTDVIGWRGQSIHRPEGTTGVDLYDLGGNDVRTKPI